jgi:aminoglycoside phosphotransferase (APT) family kinase protein
MERSATRRVSLVHGDWSPKNLLVGDGQLWAIDWEVIHYGDPSFDAGFLLNHLLMKSIAMPQHKNAIMSLAVTFVDSLNSHIPAEGAWIDQAAFEHVPALLLARVDGKSPAEYLDSAMRREAGLIALELMSRPATSVTELFRA